MKYIDAQIIIVLNIREKTSEKIKSNARTVEKEYKDGLVYLNTLRKKDPIRDVDGEEHRLYKEIMDNVTTVGELLSYNEAEFESKGSLLAISQKTRVYVERDGRKLISENHLKNIIYDISESAGLYAREMFGAMEYSIDEIKEEKIKQAKRLKKKMATGSIHVGFDRDYKIISEKKNEIKYIKRNPKSELIIEVIQVKVKPYIENDEKEPVIIGKNQQEKDIEES